MWNLYVKIKFQEQLPFLFLQVYLDNKLPSLKTIDQNYSNVTVSFRVQVNHFEFDFQGVLNKNCWIKWYCDLMKVWQYLDSSFLDSLKITTSIIFKFYRKTLRQRVIVPWHDLKLIHDFFQSNHYSYAKTMHDWNQRLDCRIYNSRVASYLCSL